MTEIVRQSSEDPGPSVLPAGSSGGPDCTRERPGTPREVADGQLDRAVHAALARVTGGLSPTTLSLAWLDWALHLAASPEKHHALAQPFLEYWQTALVETPARHDGDSDPRFTDPDWDRLPFNLLRAMFLQFESFWRDATTGLRGVSPHHEQLVSFAARQWTDMLSPSNCWWLNPEVLRAIAATGGRNFIDGSRHWLEDQQALLAGSVPGPLRRLCAPHCVGRDVAVTPGKVVYRNALIELIQYLPQTLTVRREPVLIVPSWILKYYILDLSPHNSLVRYLVEQGYTVFMISWKNPHAEARDTGLNDYLEQGLFDALAQIRRISGAAPVHTAGYCLGGTLLAIGAAARARDTGSGSAGLQTVTLFAAQTDFSEPGELGLFVDASELAYLDALMWEQGYLDGPQMASAFQLLHSRDLVWSRLVHEYLLGQRTKRTDLMAWNADTTRLPYRMHSENLTRLYLRNDLAEGRYCVDGRAVALGDLRLPVFLVGTERDHVSPWRSVYRLHLMTDTEISFLLTSGGHNAGIVSEPGHAGRHYRSGTRRNGDSNVSPDEWYASTPERDGSWWPCWQQWLAAHSGDRVAPPRVGAGTVLGDAPGTYVLEP
ncbi:alpha/beta fold hydrolase [Paraburkholderia sp. BL10I2N1]|uniref:PHA/PHB synthase family protein n=1 Tax=Paraburkholderia sp. BL10I2N1 TaxID=1938796 RepID=UPI00105C45BB|nr:alpha/beta fold hydrolase [Paraburkholderia sp. BL10I2N1]